MRTANVSHGGFTLVEMIVVMVITGIIGGMVAMFIRAPVQGYVDSSRRAEMGDIADTALRRLGRDIRTAVPNSVRVPVASCAATSGTPCYLEFLPTRDGGRYRAAPAAAGSVVCGSYIGAILDFDTADACFEIIGAPMTFTATDQIVIGSTQSSGNPPYISTFAGNGVRRAYTGTAGARSFVSITAERLPVFAEVPGQRFDVVPGDQQAVTYACQNVATDANGDGTGSLMRYWAYGFNPVQLAPQSAWTSALLADRVSACEISYDTINQRSGLVEIRLGISRGGESISLFHAIHVNNVP